MDGITIGIKSRLNNEHQTISTIYSILAQKIEIPSQVIVAGNCQFNYLSSSLLDKIELFELDSSSHITPTSLRLSNFICQHATYDHIILLEDDVILTDGWFEVFNLEKKSFLQKFKVLNFCIKNTDGSLYKTEHLSTSNKEIKTDSVFMAHKEIIYLDKKVWSSCPWEENTLNTTEQYILWSKEILKKGFLIGSSSKAYALHNDGCFYQMGNKTIKERTNFRLPQQKSWDNIREDNLRNHYKTHRKLTQQTPTKRDYPLAQYPFQHQDQDFIPDAALPLFKRKKQTSNTFFVLWIGRLERKLGYGSASRGYIEALTEVGIDVIPFDIESGKIVDGSAHHPVSIYRNEQEYLTIHPTQANAQFITVIHERPDWAANIVVKGAPSILLFVFETTSIPFTWLESTTHYEQIWTASSFNLQTFEEAGIPADALAKVPHCLNTKNYQASLGSLHIEGLKEFRFLTILSNPNRKDLGMVLRTYFKTFTKKCPVSLIIKLPPHGLKEDYQQIVLDPIQPDFDLEKNAEELAHVKFIQSHYSVEEMIKLYNSCDVLISMDRGKGWDMTAMEAMALGKPVIGTDWGGNTEFMNAERSYLVKTEGCNTLVDDTFLTGPAPELYRGHLWPAVFDQNLASQLTLAYGDKKLRLKKSQLSKDFIHSTFNLSNIGELLKERLTKIHEQHKTMRYANVFVHRPDLNQSTLEFVYQRKHASLTQMHQSELKRVKQQEYQKRDRIYSEINQLKKSRAYQISALISRLAKFPLKVTRYLTKSH